MRFPLTYLRHCLLLQHVEVAESSNIGCDSPIVEVMGSPPISITTIIPPIILPNHPYSRDLPPLPVAFEPLAADLDINEDLDFLYFNSDGSLDREDLEEDLGLGLGRASATITKAKKRSLIKGEEQERDKQRNNNNNSKKRDATTHPVKGK